MSDNAILIDGTKCCGCGSCQTACKGWNELPAETAGGYGTEYTRPAEPSAMTWIRVYFHEPIMDGERVARWTPVPRMCNHCRDANCLRACPEHAISDAGGWVLINPDKCIGCGTCVEVCVYRIPRLSPVHHRGKNGIVVLRRDKAHKCTACGTLRRESPACVDACPTGAMYFGNRQSLLKMAQERLTVLKAAYPRSCIYGLSQYGGLRVLTILPDSPSVFSLPENPPVLNNVISGESRSLYRLLSMVVPRFPGVKRAVYRFTSEMGRERDRIG